MKSEYLLYFGPSGIGDWCFIYPSLAGLLRKTGCAQTDIVLPRHNSGNALLRHNALIRNVYYLNRRTDWPARLIYALRLPLIATRLRRNRYRAAAISYLSNQPDNLLLLILAGVPLRIGRITRPGKLQRLAITEPIQVRDVLDKVQLHALYHADDWTSDATHEAQPPLFPPSLVEGSRATATRYVPEARDFVALGMGGGRDADWKFWPAEHYAALTRMNPKTTFVLLGGGADDAAQAERIRLLSGGNVINLVDRVNMVEALHLLSCARVVIGNDSGLANIASTLRRPTICIYGPTSPDLNGPALLGAHAARISVPCGPCFGEDQDPATAVACPHHRCLSELFPEQIHRALQQMLA